MQRAVRVERDEGSEQLCDAHILVAVRLVGPCFNALIRQRVAIVNANTISKWMGDGIGTRYVLYNTQGAVKGGEGGEGRAGRETIPRYTCSSFHGRADFHHTGTKDFLFSAVLAVPGRAACASPPMGRDRWRYICKYVDRYVCTCTRGSERELLFWAFRKRPHHMSGFGQDRITMDDNTVRIQAAVRIPPREQK